MHIFGVLNWISKLVNQLNSHNSTIEIHRNEDYSNKSIRKLGK